VARKLPIVYSPQTRIDCKPYRCELSATSCAVRHRAAHETMALVEMRKGVHLRGPDLRGCYNCPVGAYVTRRLGEIAKRTAEADGQEPAEARRWIRPFARRSKPKD